MSENEISYKIRGAIFTVYKNLGPGLFESVYEAALSHELEKLKLTVERQVGLPVVYDGIQINLGFRIDLLVNGKVIVEVKSTDAIAKVHHKQVLTYMKLMDKKLGILVNFNTDDINSSIIRKALRL